jgi:cation transport ATPase
MQHRQAIMAGIVFAALLVAVSCALKIHVKAVIVVGTAGLPRRGLALYNTPKPNIKLEKVKDIKQPICSVL